MDTAPNVDTTGVWPLWEGLLQNFTHIAHLAAKNCCMISSNLPSVHLTANVCKTVLSALCEIHAVHAPYGTLSTDPPMYFVCHHMFTNFLRHRPPALPPVQHVPVYKNA